MNRIIKNGLFMAVSSCLVIAIAVTVNLLLHYVPEEYTNYDISGKGYYELTDETEAMIKAVDEKITLYHVGREESENYFIIHEFLERYERLNSNITVETLDYEVIPSFTTDNGTVHDLTAIIENSVIVSGEKKDYVASYYDIITVELACSQEEAMMYSMYDMIPPTTETFTAEQAITGGIDNVTSDVLPKLYTLSGHNESELGATLGGYLETDNYKTEALTLMTGDGSVPEDADCLIINNPLYDISDDELETLKKYVDEGGKLVLVTAYNQYGTDFTNLYALAEHYGMKVVDGLVVDPATDYYYQQPYYITPDLSVSDSITADIEEKTVLFTMPHAITAAEELDGNITFTKLAFTSSSAYAVKIDGPEESDIKMIQNGECIVAARSSLADTGGNFVWFACEAITADISEGNSRFFISTLGSLCDKEKSVSIAGKLMDTQYLVTTEFSSLVFLVIFVAVIPVTVIGAGIVITIIRRTR